MTQNKRDYVRADGSVTVAPATVTAHIIRGDARCLPLADNTVDLIVTSPPYFALRSYQDGGEHYDGQIGAEPTPAEFVDALIACTREWMRVLKPSGSIWVNLGDKYAQPGKGERNGQGIGGTIVHKAGVNTANRSARDFDYNGVRGKSLIGVPWRYALRCVDELGLILRAEVLWSKPNGLPESVNDRVRRSHEQWFHFTREPRYFSAVDEIREATGDYKGASWADRKAAGIPSRAGQQTTETMGTVLAANPLGKLPGSVWTVPTEPLNVPAVSPLDGRPLPDHFAAFPTEWPRRIIQGWSPREVCTACGEGRRDVWEDVGLSTYARLKVAGDLMLGRDVGPISEPGNSGQTKDGNGRPVTYEAKPRRKVGFACGCAEPTARTRAGVVLDPFGGTGTTALMASVLGRLGVTVDLSHDYCRLAQWRTTDPGERARAMRVEKPPKQLAGQCDLFGEAS